MLEIRLSEKRKRKMLARVQSRGQKVRGRSGFGNMHFQVESPIQNPIKGWSDRASTMIKMTWLVSCCTRERHCWPWKMVVSIEDDKRSRGRDKLSLDRSSCRRTTKNTVVLLDREGRSSTETQLTLHFPCVILGSGRPGVGHSKHPCNVISLQMTIPIAPWGTHQVVVPIFNGQTNCRVMSYVNDNAKSTRWTI